MQQQNYSWGANFPCHNNDYGHLLCSTTQRENPTFLMMFSSSPSTRNNASVSIQNYNKRLTQVESILPAARICAVHEARPGLVLPDLQVPPLQNFAALRVFFSARKRHFCARGRGLPEDDDEDVEATETKPPEVESGGAAIAAITISSFITCM
jgi:hypothetical protein